MTNQWYDYQPNDNAFKRLLKRIRSGTSKVFNLKPQPGFRNGRPDKYESETFKKLKARLLNWTLAFGHWFQLSVLPVLRRFNWRLIQGVAGVLVVSFFLANSISTFAASGIMSLTRSSVKPGQSKKSSAVEDGGVSVISGPVTLGSPALANTVSLKKDILQRNVFNSEGKLAPEANKDDNKGARKDLTIDFENVACQTGDLPVQINGTIFTGDPKKSLVILKDAKIQDADIYKPGDAIIDHEDYEIYKVERGVLEVRKGNNKICVAISGYGGKVAGEGGGDFSSSSGKAPGESKEFEFDAAFISQEIGPGYATILNCAKLIPEIDPSGKMQGFKMISIATSCLFDRIQIQNGDILTEVNGVSLKDAGQGFKIYQSLQEERTTTIHMLRNGEPITRIVRVK